MNPELSIIIPTFNEEKYLPKLLESIKKQVYTNYEIIVADNNSKDRTRQIAKEYRCRLTKGGAPAVGRNNGAKLAKGRLLLLLDADFILPENFLESCIEEFKKRKLDVATCLFKIKNKKLIDKLILFSGNILILSAQYFDPHSTGAFVLCKKIIFNKLKGFDEKLKQAEDHDFVKRSSKIGIFGVLKKNLFWSMRRFEKEGRINILKKYIKSEFYRKVKGNIDFNIVEYEYGKF